MPEDLVLLADDVFTNYFPDANSKNVLVDASLLLSNDWHSIATDVWQTPKEIFDKLVSNRCVYETGVVMMYTCMIQGQESHLFYEVDKWFMERK